MTPPQGDRIISELEALRKNIAELQEALQHAYIRIGELTSDLYEFRKIPNLGINPAVKIDSEDSGNDGKNLVDSVPYNHNRDRS